MRTSSEIIDRCFSLLLIADRGLLEKASHSGGTYTKAQREGKRQLFLQIVNDREIPLSQLEHNILESPVGDLDEETFWRTQWQYEAIPVLLWIVAKCKILPYDGKPCEIDFHPLLGKHCTPQTKVHIKRIRPLSELLVMRDVALLWHWRCIEGERSTSQSQFKNKDVGELINRTFGDKFFGLRIGNIIKRIPLSSPPIRDFRVGVLPFWQVPGEILTRILAQALWRHHAFEWVLGDSEWETTETNT